MAGKSIYFTEKELEMIFLAFDYGNFSFEGSDKTEEEIEEKYELAENIRRKVSKFK